MLLLLSRVWLLAVESDSDCDFEVDSVDVVVVSQASIETRTSIDW